jgi:DNA-binding MarR family transcriptional regulator
MRGHRRAELTVPQFRALVFLSHNEDSSLSAMAAHLGLSLPATSRLAEVLVQRGLMERQSRSNDRRCVSLSLTERGWATYRAALRATQAAIARRCDTLTAEELSQVAQAMGILNRVFSSESCGTESMP